MYLFCNFMVSFSLRVKHIMIFHFFVQRVYVSMCAHMWEFDMNILYTMWEAGEGSEVWWAVSAAARVVKNFIFNSPIFQDL